MDNRAIVIHVFTELAQGSTAPCVAAMADDFTWRPMGRGVWGKVYRGKDVVRRTLFAPLHAQYEGPPTIVADAIHADGGHVVVEARGSATTRAGKPYNNRYCFIIPLPPAKPRTPSRRRAGPPA